MNALMMISLFNFKVPRKTLMNFRRKQKRPFDIKVALNLK